MNEEATRAHLDSLTDEQVLRIVLGFEDYTPRATEIALQVLKERNVPIPGNIDQLRHEVVTAVATQQHVLENGQRSTYARWCIAIGLGSLILPLFGLQFRVLRPFGDATYLIGGALFATGLALLPRAASSSGDSEESAHEESPSQ